MNFLKVKTDGTHICGRWYNAGTYQTSVQTRFHGPGYYWLAPTAERKGERWLGIGIHLGECITATDLVKAVAIITDANVEIEDPIWLLGAATEKG